jgi:hypothetical protein
VKKPIEASTAPWAQKAAQREQSCTYTSEEKRGIPAVSNNDTRPTVAQLVEALRRCGTFFNIEKGIGVFPCELEPQAPADALHKWGVWPAATEWCGRRFIFKNTDCAIEHFWRFQGHLIDTTLPILDSRKNIKPSRNSLSFEREWEGATFQYLATCTSDESGSYRLVALCLSLSRTH